MYSIFQFENDALVDIRHNLTLFQRHIDITVNAALKTEKLNMFDKLSVVIRYDIFECCRIKIQIQITVSKPLNFF